MRGFFGLAPGLLFRARKLYWYMRRGADDARRAVRVIALVGADECFEEQHEFLGEHVFSPPSNPTVLMSGHAGEAVAAGLLIDQVDDECPHIRTPLAEPRC